MSEEQELTDDQLWELTTTEDLRERAEAMSTLGWRLYRRDENEKAVSLAGEARAIYKDLQDFQEEGRSAYLEGVSHLDAGRNQEAIDCLDHAADLYRVWASEEMLADAARNKARALANLEKVPDAAASYESAIALYESNEKFTLAGIAALDLGELLGYHGQQSKALEWFTDSLRIFKKGGDLIGAGRSHDRMAAALIDLGNMNEAIEHLREGLNIFTYIDDEGRKTWAQYRLGWTLVSNDEPVEAIPLLKEASASYKAMKQFTNAANADTQLAHALTRLGEVDEAVELYKMTRSIYEAAGDMNSAYLADINTADKTLSQDIERAIALYRRVIAGATEVKDDWIFRAATIRLSEALQKLDTEEAYAEALTVLQAIDVEAWGEDLGNRTWHLNALANTLIELGRDEEASNYFQEVVAFGYETGFLEESAKAHAGLALIEGARGNTAISNDLLSKSIAFFLAAGKDEEARNLSIRLLPPKPQNLNVLQTDVQPVAGETDLG